MTKGTKPKIDKSGIKIVHQCILQVYSLYGMISSCLITAPTSFICCKAILLTGILSFMCLHSMYITEVITNSEIIAAVNRKNFYSEIVEKEIYVRQI